MCRNKVTLKIPTTDRFRSWKCRLIVMSVDGDLTTEYPPYCAEVIFNKPAQLSLGDYMWTLSIIIIRHRNYWSWDVINLDLQTEKHITHVDTVNCYNGLRQLILVRTSIIFLVQTNKLLLLYLLICIIIYADSTESAKLVSNINYNN